MKYTILFICLILITSCEKPNVIAGTWINYSTSKSNSDGSATVLYNFTSDGLGKMSFEGEEFGKKVSVNSKIKWMISDSLKKKYLVITNELVNGNIDGQQITSTEDSYKTNKFEIVKLTENELIVLLNDDKETRFVRKK